MQLILCHNNVTYEYTSSVAPRHTQRITSQAHKTQTKNKRIKRSSVTNQYAMSLEDGISAWKYST